MKLTTKQTFQFYFKHLRRYRLLTATIVSAIVLAVFTALTTPYLYKIFFDTITQPGLLLSVYPELFKIVLLILGINLLQMFFWRIAGFSNAFFQSRVMANIQNECFEYLHRHSHDFFNSNFTGALVKKVSRLVRGFEGVADRIIWDLIPLTIRVMVIIAVLTYTNPLIGALFSLWSGLFVFFNYLFSRYKFKFDIIKAAADSKVTAYLADTVTNNANVKLFASLRYEINRFRKVTDDWFSKTLKSWNLDNIVEGIQAFLMTILEFTIFIFAIRFFERGLLTIGDFVLIHAYIFELFGQLWNFGRTLRGLYENLADAEEMIVILNTPHAIKDQPKAKRLGVNRGQIEFKNVAFGYDKQPNVITDLSFNIKPGEKIALIGPSGEGKSTIAKLLVRFFETTGGQILIDRQDVTKITLDSLRDQISLVPQDPILFHRSLLENIRYGRRTASEKEVMAAARLAYCHKFIEALPNKYDTFVGERGIKLSGGQRQRVAIARAILKNAPILILDEATSSLDSHAESLIQKALANLMKNKTTIVIAHRLSTIAQMDRIFVIKKGQIAEFGSHLELLQKPDSLYRKLWNLQVGAYERSHQSWPQAATIK